MLEHIPLGSVNAFMTTTSRQVVSPTKLLIFGSMLVIVIGIGLFLPKRKNVIFDSEGHARVFGIFLDQPNVRRSMFQSLRALNTRLSFSFSKTNSAASISKAWPIIDEASRYGLTAESKHEVQRIKI